MSVSAETFDFTARDTVPAEMVLGDAESKEARQLCSVHNVRSSLIRRVMMDQTDPFTHECNLAKRYRGTSMSSLEGAHVGISLGCSATYLL